MEINDFDYGLYNDKWKIEDLGLSQPVNNALSNNKIYGVIPYIAPEIFKESAFSKKSDVYCMGMIMWELTMSDTKSCRVVLYANAQVKKSNTPAKRKCTISSKKKSTRIITIHSDSEDDCNGNNRDDKENILNFNELEYREKDLALKERELALRE
ncbi:hypothetical protein C1645_827204 [Glomus cerebriforme]|uniref:Protein kinase domain-containing protein n=1 Tax=Glomus cerebriforme TaxID=658196 RepID=A0A397SQ65_9GLOM|nr:hypothetical protein C1645_827204 [Glomus cerebriforme]